MRYVASLYVQDTRPEKPAKVAKDAEPPKGGYRTKSGVKKLGDRAVIQAESLSDALAKLTPLLEGIPADVQGSIVRLKVEADAGSAKDANPFTS